jgi:predicted ATPase
MLTELHLLNFKSFTDETIPLAPMTLLAGVNNTGKSTVIQALRMLWKWATVGDPTLPGHGSLKEMKKAKTAPIKVVYYFSGRHHVEMHVEFMDSDHPTINPFETSCSPLPFMSYVSADRWGPRVSLPIDTSVADLTHVGEHGEYVIDFLSRHERDIVSATLIHPNAEGETLEYNVRAWLEEISPNVDFKHGTDPQRDASYATIDGYRPPNTGFGLSYTLPVIVSLLGMSAEWEDDERQKLKTDHGGLVLLENPEAHLHPKGQTAMGRLIALAAASGVQVIVETHSENLMDGIRIAVKAGQLSSDMTAFHYFTLNKDRTTSVESPILYSNGKLDHWPKGFFDQTRKNKAILARRS